jgi:DNA/RNA endonuclease YhcR with UshA esterase domain
VPVYSVSNEQTVQGAVQDVQEFYCPISGDVGTHLLVKTDHGTFQVHIAPLRFLRDKKLSFSKGDQIEVVGSRIIYNGHEALIARTVIRGDQTVAFRKPNGKPMWLE